MQLFEVGQADRSQIHAFNHGFGQAEVGEPQGIVGIPLILIHVIMPPQGSENAVAGGWGNIQSPADFFVGEAALVVSTEKLEDVVYLVYRRHNLESYCESVLGSSKWCQCRFLAPIHARVAVTIKAVTYL
jgi:hypothetical protein